MKQVCIGKIIFLGISLMVLPVLFLYSQEEAQSVTFTEADHLGNQRVTRTVNATFFGWMQQIIRLEGNIMSEYQSFRPINGEWSEWELLQRFPGRGGTISQEFDATRRFFEDIPDFGLLIPMDMGITLLRKIDIPPGQRIPVRWGTDGATFITFHRVYVIVE